jgi:hypothetical protein
MVLGRVVIIHHESKSQRNKEIKDALKAIQIAICFSDNHTNYMGMADLLGFLGSKLKCKK